MKYCTFCKIYPKQVTVRYIEPVEDYYFYNEEKKEYELTNSTHETCSTGLFKNELVNDVSTVSIGRERVVLCGICDRKVEDAPKEKQSVTNVLF